MESEKKVSLTEEHLRDVAVSYISMKDKEEFIKDVSPGCFDRMEIGTENGVSGNTARNDKSLTCSEAFGEIVYSRSCFLCKNRTNSS